MQVHRVTTLRWLRPELLAALGSLRELLLSAPSAGSGLQQALDRFRAIRGVLALVEAHPGELLAEEGTALLQWLVDRGGDAGDEARYLLLRAVTVLEWHLQASAAYGAEEIVPLLNDLRTLRGERFFCESYLFAADLSLPQADAGAVSTGSESPPPEAMPAYVRRLRSHYQRGLVQWLRRPETGEGLELMAMATGHLQDICADYPLAGLYRLATAFLEALRSRAAQVSISVRSLLTQVDQEIRRLAERGLDGMAQSAPEGLTKGLVYYLAQGTGAQHRKAGPGVDVGNARRALARGGDIIANLVVDEPVAVNDLGELATILARTADTLALLGLASARRSLLPSLMVLQEALTKHTAPSEEDLPVLAANLLEGDQALEAFVEVEATATAPGAAESAAAPDGGFLRSAAEELLAIRTAVAPLLADTGPVQDTDALMDRFRRIREGLLDEGLGSGAAISSDCAAELETAIGDGEWPLADEQRDACAEALVGFGYYLDALADGVAPAEGVLEYIKGRLAVPVPLPVGTGAVDSDEDPEAGPASDPHDIGEAVAAEVAPVSRAEEAMPRGGPPGAGGLPERVAYSIRHARALLQTIEGPWAVVAEPTAEPGATPLQSRAVCADPEFVDVFVEEANPIVEEIKVQLARWRERPADKEISERVRRAFQGLKTSARSAGASEIAELAAALERLMIAGVTAEVTPATIALLLDAHGRLSESVQALEDDEAVALDFENLLGRIASAQQVLVLPSPESAAGVLPGADRFLAEAERPSVPEAGTAEELAELRRVFADEADEILQDCSSLQADWQAESHGNEVVRQLHRHLHTLKGSARTAGLNAVSDLCHSEESLLTKVLAGSVAPTPALKSLVQRCHDRLAGMVGIVRVGLLPSPAQDLAEEIRVVLDGDQAPMAQQGAASDLPGVPANGAGVSHDSPARVPVSAEKLDELSHIAGEINLSRGQVERQVGATRGSLEDMDATLHRLRRQLGRLEADMQAPTPLGTGGQDEPAPRDSTRDAELRQTARAVSASLSDLENLREALEGLALDSQTALREQARASEDLQRGLVSSRLVPLAPHVPRLRRLVSSTAEELGKRAELVVEGDDVRLDAQVLSRLIAPLEHMLRNAIDHGVESPEDRLRLGKPVSAQLRLTVSWSGPDVLVCLTDDGGGLDLAAIRREAAERGLISQEAPVPDEQLLSCVFEQEFTTAPQVTQISGRGVGLDVVHSVVRQLGGGLSLNTRPGEGTEFTIRLPAVPSTSRVLMTRVGDGHYAVPLNWVEGVVRMDETELGAARSAEPPCVERRGRVYHLAHLASLLGEDRPVIRRHQGHYSVVLVRAGDHPTALLVDAVTVRRELVVEPVAPPASLVGWMAGAALAEEGGLVFVLDMLELCARATAQPLSAELETAEVPAEASSPLVLVVDDSITLRKVTERLLARHGMHVALVRDRSEALTFLQDRLPDVVVIDVDNSGTEGHQLADYLRHDPRYSALPVIMLTPRGGQGHGNGAARRAVEVDLAKPYREGTLVDAVLGVLGHA